MAFVTVEGLEGSVEIVCFPAIYQENKDLLVEDKVVKIKGRVDHKDESETKFIPLAMEAFTPKTGLEPLALSVDGDRLPSTVIDDLKGILVRFPGRCSVDMYVRMGEGARRLRFGRRLPGGAAGQPVRRTEGASGRGLRMPGSAKPVRMRELRRCRACGGGLEVAALRPSEATEPWRSPRRWPRSWPTCGRGAMPR